MVLLKSQSIRCENKNTGCSFFYDSYKQQDCATHLEDMSSTSTLPLLVIRTLQ